jgi:hypothetical protein
VLRIHESRPTAAGKFSCAKGETAQAEISTKHWRWIHALSLRVLSPIFKRPFAFLPVITILGVVGTVAALETSKKHTTQSHNGVMTVMAAAHATLFTRCCRCF